MVGVLGKDVERAIQSLVRAVRARRLYADNNATLVRVMSDAYSAMQDVLRSTPLLTLNIRSDALLVEDQRFAEETSTEESIAFVLFRDGVRRLDVMQGFDKRELDLLVSSIAQGTKFTGLGDDVVSLLWRGEPQYLRYVVVDTTIIDATEGDGAFGTGGVDDMTPAADVEHLVETIYGAHVAAVDSVRTSVSLDSSDPTAKRLADSLDALDEDFTGLYPLRSLGPPPAYTSNLTVALSSDNPSSLALRVADIVIDALAGSIATYEINSLSEALTLIYDSALTASDLELATHLISRVDAVSDSALDYVRDRYDRWLDEATSETRVGQFLPTQRGVVEPELGRRINFFKACGGRTIPLLLSTLGACAEVDLRKRLTTLISEIGVPDPGMLRDLLRSNEPGIAAEAVILLSGMQGEDAHRMLFDLRADPRADVRLAMLEAIDRNRDEEAHVLAGMLLQDPDPAVSSAAVRTLSKMQSPDAAKTVEALIRAPGFDDRPAEQKRAFLEGWARMQPARALIYLGNLIKNGDRLLLEKAKEDVCIAAIDAVALIRLQRTVEILKVACSSKNKRIRETARETLLRMKGPA